MTDDDAPHAFADLTPDSILDAVESIGFRIDASLLELNSYENRVYQIGIEERRLSSPSFIERSAGQMLKSVKNTHSVSICSMRNSPSFRQSKRTAKVSFTTKAYAFHYSTTRGTSATG